MGCDFKQGTVIRIERVGGGVVDMIGHKQRQSSTLKIVDDLASRGGYPLRDTMIPERLWLADSLGISPVKLSDWVVYLSVAVEILVRLLQPARKSYSATRVCELIGALLDFMRSRRIHSR
jgi:hypothetical protein